MMEVLVMSAGEAAALRAATGQAECRLEPLMARAGPFVGEHLLPARVIGDPAFAELAETLAAFARAEIDPALAWPPEDMTI